MNRIFSQTLIRFLSVVLIFTPVATLAAMSGTQYTIYADSIDVGGVGLSEGTDYSLQATLGEAIAGTSSSTSGYEVRAGFQSLERTDLSLTLDQTTLSLGELSRTAIKSASAVATVTSYAPSGYSLSVGSVSGSITATVNDNEVTVGENEYGISVTGSDAAYAGDKAVAAGLVVASASDETVNEVTTLTFKGSRSDSATAGTYSQSVVLQLSANF